MCKTQLLLQMIHVQKAQIIPTLKKQFMIVSFAKSMNFTKYLPRLLNYAKVSRLNTLTKHFCSINNKTRACSKSPSRMIYILNFHLLEDLLLKNSSINSNLHHYYIAHHIPVKNLEI